MEKSVMSFLDGIGGLIGIGGSIAGGIIGSSQEKKAAQIAANANQQAIDLQRDIFNQTQANYKPWLDIGKSALPGIKKAVIGGDMSGFYKSPGYQFRLDEGLKAVDRGAGARGLLGSGARLKALSDYGQGTASSEYQNYLNNLYNVAGMGQTGAAGTASAGANYGSNAGNAMINAGAQRASGYSNAAGAMTQGINNAISSLYGFGGNSGGAGSMANWF
jgi:hypothetical protein